MTEKELKSLQDDTRLLRAESVARARAIAARARRCLAHESGEHRQSCEASAEPDAEDGQVAP